MYTKYKTGSMPSETRLFYRLQLIIQHGVSPHTRIYHSHRQEARSLFLSYGGQLPWIGSAFMIEKMESDLSNQHFRLLFCCPTNFSLSSFDLHRSQYQIHYVYYRAHIVLYTITFPSSTVKYSYNYFLQSTGAGFFFFGPTLVYCYTSQVVSSYLATLPFLVRCQEHGGWCPLPPPASPNSQFQFCGQDICRHNQLYVQQCPIVNTNELVGGRLYLRREVMRCQVARQSGDSYHAPPFLEEKPVLCKILRQSVQTSHSEKLCIRIATCAKQ